MWSGKTASLKGRFPYRSANGFMSPSTSLSPFLSVSRTSRVCLALTLDRWVVYEKKKIWKKAWGHLSSSKIEKGLASPPVNAFHRWRRVNDPFNACDKSLRRISKLARHSPDDGGILLLIRSILGTHTTGPVLSPSWSVKSNAMTDPNKQNKPERDELSHSTRNYCRVSPKIAEQTSLTL